MKNFLSLVLFNIFVTILSADISYEDNNGFNGVTNADYNEKFQILYPEVCTKALEAFAQYASDLSFCSILNSRPITLCEKCIDQYIKFSDKYNELVKTVVNGTSCGSLYMSQDRLNVVMDYHDGIALMWTKGNCNTCYDWNGAIPILKNETMIFKKMYNDTMNCISKYTPPDADNSVCNNCFDTYVQLDTFYKTLSKDEIGVDTICMDIVDSMNATRLIWSKNLNCCQLRRTPQIPFLCCASIISLLPVVYYLAVRFCGPIRVLPIVLKQSRIKQNILSSIDEINE